VVRPRFDNYQKCIVQWYVRHPLCIRLLSTPELFEVSWSSLRACGTRKVGCGVSGGVTRGVWKFLSRECSQYNVATI
jgi:hypothetical protein